MIVLSSVLPSNQLYRRLLLALGVATAALAGYFFIAGRPRHKKLGAVVKSGRSNIYIDRCRKAFSAINTKFPSRSLEVFPR